MKSNEILKKKFQLKKHHIYRALNKTICTSNKLVFLFLYTNIQVLSLTFSLSLLFVCLPKFETFLTLHRSSSINVLQAKRERCQYCEDVKTCIHGKKTTKSL